MFNAGFRDKNVWILLVIHPFRPLKGKPKPNANVVDKTCIGCFALVSPLGDGRGRGFGNAESRYLIGLKPALVLSFSLYMMALP